MKKGERLTRGKRTRRWVISGACTVVLALAVVVCVKTDVFGKFQPAKPFVKQDTEGNPIPSGLTSSTVTTDGGLKGKGTKEEPFVVLEIVPDLAQQQLTYLHPDNPDYPLGSVLQIGIDNESGNDFNTTNMGLHNSIGDWFCNYNYEVYKIGSETEKEKVKLAEGGKVYTLTLSKEDVERPKDGNGNSYYSFSEFENDYNNKSMQDLIANYSELFKKDNNGQTIDEITKTGNGANHWVKSKEQRAQEDESRVYHEVVATSEDINFNQHYCPGPTVVQNNKDAEIFKKDKEGNVISSAVRDDFNNWERVGDVDSIQYNYTVVTDQISAADYNRYKSGEISLSELAALYPNVFERDKDNKRIERSRLNSSEWTSNEGGLKTLNSGYFHYVGTGGQYNAESKWSQELATNYVYLGDADSNGQWDYVEELPAGARVGTDINTWNNNNGGKTSSYYWDLKTFSHGIYGGGVVPVAMDGKGNYTFSYNKTVYSITLKYESGNKVNVYKFTYYGLKQTDILKRSLFTFESQQACDEFVLDVIAMTPEELNNNPSLINDADMIYVGEYTSQTDSIQKVYENYYKYIAKDPNYSYANEGKLKSFEDNDLEWNLVYKIMDRLANNANLPVIMTKAIGNIVEAGMGQDPDTHMNIVYPIVTPEPTAAPSGAPTPEPTPVVEPTATPYLYQNEHIKGCINNIAKLYLCTIQFDMLARKDEGYLRTFYEDILPNFKTIELNEPKSKAKTTGYYERVLSDNCGTCGGTLDNAANKSCYYLWNTYTFYPPQIPLKAGGGKDKVAENSEYVKYGYLDSYFTTNADPFRDFGVDHHTGSDGQDDKNVGVVGTYIANTNQSTILGSTGTGEDVANNILNVAYHIINRPSGKMASLKLSVLPQKKYYQKLSDEAVLIDYNTTSTYSPKTMYLKVKISNSNNSAGIIKSIHLKKETAKLQGELVPQRTLDKGTALTKEPVKDSQGKNLDIGYEVPANGSVTLFIPYELTDWQKGYNVINVNMRASNTMQKGKKITTSIGKAEDYEVTISERSLFNLE